MIRYCDAVEVLAISTLNEIALANCSASRRKNYMSGNQSKDMLVLFGRAAGCAKWLHGIVRLQDELARAALSALLQRDCIRILITGQSPASRRQQRHKLRVGHAVPPDME